jgi:hypothetical protein
LHPLAPEASASTSSTTSANRFLKLDASNNDVKRASSELRNHNSVKKRFGGFNGFGGYYGNSLVNGNAGRIAPPAVPQSPKIL